MSTTPDSAPSPAIPLAGLLGSIAVGLAAGAVVLQPIPAPPPAATAGCRLTPPGYLQGRLYGDLAQTLNWRGDELRCDGMLRGEDGLRLMFGGAGSAGQGSLTLVVGIAGSFAGLPGSERPANVTLIDESAGRFYATGGFGRCWTQVAAAEPAGPVDYRISGTLYCAGALPALQGAGEVTLGDLRYAGRLIIE
jgi:hypothetical protein